jgi:hypothetical protein
MQKLRLKTVTPNLSTLSNYCCVLRGSILAREVTKELRGLVILVCFICSREMTKRYLLDSGYTWTNRK